MIFAELLQAYGVFARDIHAVSNLGTELTVSKSPTERHWLISEDVVILKQGKRTEANTPYRTRESLPKGLHVIEHFVSLLLVFFGVTGPGLPVRKGLPCKAHHLLIAATQQADRVDHLGQEASNVGAATESKEVQVIVDIIGIHEEAIGGHDMLVEAGADGLVLGFGIRRTDLGEAACASEVVVCDICADARLVVCI